MDRQEVVNAARAEGLGEWAEALAREARPSIRLVIGDEPGDALGSRLGGEPELPTEHPWPVSHDRPQAFIGQVELEAIPHAAAFGLPAAGMLSFFFDAEQRLWSPEPEHRGAWQVTWFEPGTPLEPRSAPADLDPEARIDARSVSPALEWTLPPWDSPEMDRIGLPQAFGRGVDLANDGYEALAERLAAAPGQPRHRMFGYPDQIQGDIRWEAEVDTVRSEHGATVAVADAYDPAVPPPD